MPPAGVIQVVQVAGLLAAKSVLVRGATGAVGECALQFALQACARTISACRKAEDCDADLRAGAHAAALLVSGFC